MDNVNVKKRSLCSVKSRVLEYCQGVLINSTMINRIVEGF